jgi:hypothetical protein
MIKNIITLALLLALVPWFPADVQASNGTHTVIASGFSRIYGNVGEARTAALAESIRFALHKATEGILSEDQFTHDFEAISRVLHRNPNQYIQEYRILKEYQADKSYRVLVQATVMTDKIQEALSLEGLQTRSAELPAILFMIAEKHLDDLNYGYWWKDGFERAAPDTAALPMAGTMKEAGYTVIDPLGITNGRGFYNEGLSLTAAPADYEAAVFARRAGAHLVILGQAEATRGQNRMGTDIRTYNGNITLRVIDTQTGQVVTSIRRQAVSIGEDPGAASKNAMVDAAYQAGLQLSSRIDSIWRQKEAPAGGITISIAGRNILPDLEQFRRTISESPGISAIRTIQMSPHAARLWVDYKGTPDELVDSLLKQSYGPFGINIRETAPDMLEIEVIRDMSSEILTE